MSTEEPDQSANVPKAVRFDLIPGEALWELALLYGRGADKYAERNWERGTKFSISFASMMRHAWRYAMGEDQDEEMGVSHMACVAFHAFTIMTMAKRGRSDMDDRGR